jgi:hypothetical protein
LPCELLDALAIHARDETWLGDANTDESERTLIVKCPDGTSADAVQALPDEEGVVMVVECNYPK